MTDLMGMGIPDKPTQPRDEGGQFTQTLPASPFHETEPPPLSQPGQSAQSQDNDGDLLSGLGQAAGSPAAGPSQQPQVPAPPEGWTPVHDAWAKEANYPIKQAYAMGADQFLNSVEMLYSRAPQPQQPPPGPMQPQFPGQYPQQYVQQYPDSAAAPAPGQPALPGQQFSPPQSPPQLPQLDTEGLDDSVVNWANSASQQFTAQQEQIDRLTKATQDMHGVMHSQHQIDLANQERVMIDSIFEGMNESRFGRGPSDTLPQGQLQRRVAVVNGMISERQRREARGELMPPWAVVAQIVDQTLYGSLIDGAMSAVVQRSSQLASQTTTPPDQSQTPTGEEIGDMAAVSATAAKMREMGMNR